MITKISILSKFQNQTIRVISSLVIALAMVFSSMAFVDYKVHAEGSNYVTMPYSDIITSSRPSNAIQIATGSGGWILYAWTNTNPATNEVRLTVIDNVAYYVSDTSGMVIRFRSSGGYTDGITGFSGSYNGYYVLAKSSTVANRSWTYDNNISSSDYSNINNIYQLAYELTFGEYSDGSSGINYGDIKDLAYSTKISGSSVDQNHDCITWYPYWDTNNNIAINWDMEIRVVPGTYTSDTQNGLFNLDPSHFVTNLGASVYVYQGAFSQGSIEVSWLRIKELLTPLQFATSGLFSFFDGEYWTKKGWMYQARYIDPENEYTSEWQNIYTVTSSSGKGVEDVIDPSTETNLPDFYNNVTDSYNDIFNTTSVVNNNYNQIYYVNNAPYVVNPSDEPEEPDSNTDKILEDILRVTIQIRQLIQQDQDDGDERQPDDTGLKDKDDELHDREQELIDDMDDKLEDIDTDVELISNNGFLAAANWVRAQYDHLTLNTPFELVIVFALVLGIALIFIGKVR